MGRVLIFPDTKIEAGAGHLTRCTALAERLAEKGAKVVFVRRAEGPSAFDYLPDFNWPVKSAGGSGSAAGDPASIREAIGPGDIDWLVVDDYSIDSSWLARAREFFPKLAVIDDLADRFLDCDLLLNQNLGFDRSYEDLLPASTRRLLGPDYALLRREFAEARACGLRPREGQVARLLIFMGGADSVDNTGKAVGATALLGDKNLAVDIVVSSGYQFIDRLQEALTAAGIAAIVHKGAAAKEMARLMEAADLSIGTAGSSSWERCCLGLPAVLLVTADNQRPVAQELSSRDAAVALEARDGLDEKALADILAAMIKNSDRLAAMSEAAGALVDGRGAEKVACEMLG